MSGSDSTISHVEEDARDTWITAPILYVALDCERPMTPTLRISLLDIDEVILGRGKERSCEASGARLTLRLADLWMSSMHARLRRTTAGWELEDLGSKNGTIRDGSPCQREVVSPGDLIEVGHTLLLFCEVLLPQRGPREIEASELRPPVPELATFLTPLARQFDALASVATRTSVSMMIFGESGTGKEIVARAVHRLSARQGSFVGVNCASIPSGLFEAELFGSKKGAFTGATDNRLGLIRASDGGTLFLDEIGDLPPASQISLLRVLQEREVLPLGAVRAVPVDLRVLTATHQNLRALTELQQFRPDLLARLNGFQITLPTLTERVEDIGMLIAALLRRGAPQPETVRFTGRAARALFRYEWPLNIRELEKCLATAAALAGNDAIDLGHLPEGVRSAVLQRASSFGAQPAAHNLSKEDRALRDRLLAQLAEHRGNIAASARAMGKAPMQVHRWIRRFGINVQELRRRS